MQEGLKLQLLHEVNRRLKSTLPEASIEIVSLPGLPSVRLGLINSDFPTGPLDADTMNAVCLLYTSPSPRDGLLSRMPSSA